MSTHDNMTDKYVDYFGDYQHADRHCKRLGKTVWKHSNNHVLSRKVGAHKREDCPECCQ